MRVSKQDICNELGITMASLMSAIYSGRIPEPTLADTWEESHVRFYIDNWRASIESRHKKLSTSCVRPGFPVHTR